MRRRIVVLAFVCVIALACDPLSRSEVVLTFDETGERVSVEVSSDDRHVAVFHEDDGDRLAADVMAARDEWSLRFANAKTESERITIDRSGRKIKGISQQGGFASSDLDKFFSDVSATVQFLRGDRWAELTIYPGTSTRASRDQRLLLQRQLNTYSVAAAHYVDAVRDLYSYLEPNPARAEEVIYGVMADEADDVSVSDDERKLVAAVRKTAEELFSLDDGGSDQRLFGRTADLVYNPFPGVITVRVKGEVLELEGFTKNSDGDLILSTATPLEALQSLEGKWISPEIIGNDVPSGMSKREAAKQFAAKPRKAAPVVLPSDIVDALAKAMQPAPRYRVRWTTKPATDKAGPPGATTRSSRR